MDTMVLSDMEKINGANFTLWKSKMDDILIFKDKYLPIEGVEKKSSSIAYEYWNKLGRKFIVIIWKCRVNNIYFSASGEKTP